jgi:hypothetical protein
VTICALAGFVVMRCTDPDGSRSHIGALLLGYYTDDKSGRAGFGSEPNRMFGPGKTSLAHDGSSVAAGAPMPGFRRPCAVNQICALESSPQ